MAGEKTMDRKACAAWPGLEAGAVSGKMAASAALSLGMLLLVLESDRLSGLMRIDGSTGIPLLITPGSIALLGICALCLCLRPAGRPAPMGYLVLAALVSSLSLASMFYLKSDPSLYALYVVGDLLYPIGCAALLYFWVQRVMPFGRPFIIQSFGAGAIILGCLSMLTMALEHSIAMLLVVVLPLVGVGFLLAVDTGEVSCVEVAEDAAGARAPAGQGAVGMGEGAASSCLGAEAAARVRWNGLRAIAQGGATAAWGLTGASDIGTARVAVRALLKLMPFLCYAVIFGNVHFSWIDLQDSGAVGVWIQLGASVGSMVCGFAALGLTRLHWGRAFENIMHLLVTALTLMALWLSAFLTSGYVFAYLVLLNIAQKLAFLLILLFGFPFARNSRECTSLWALAYFSFLAGTCVSFLMSNLHVAGALNIIAVTALAMVFVIDIINIATLYGDKPSALTMVPAAKGEPANETSLPEGPAVAEEPTVGQAAGAPERVGSSSVSASASVPVPGFDALPYTCHLIACRFDLTRREEEILQLLVRGRTASRISEALCITPATTRTHLRNIYAKLDVHSQQDVLDLFEEYGVPTA